MRMCVRVAAAGVLLLLGGCLGEHQQPLSVASISPVPVGVMPQPDDADVSQPDPKSVTALKRGDSILIETPADAAAARAQKQAMLKSLENGMKAVPFSKPQTN